MKAQAVTSEDLSSHPLAGETNFDQVLPYFLGISSFVAGHLPADSHIKLRKERAMKEKTISDPIVGYVRMTPLEVDLLDTPLFQRLRRISQLSFVEQVYPSLGYRRFEHTVGVLGRVLQMLSSLSTNAQFTPEGERVPIDHHIKSSSTALRIAALFHDVGHCIYSHASESFIAMVQGEDSNYPSAAIIQDFFRGAFRLNKIPPVAEVFAVSILLSPEVLHYIIEIHKPNRGEAEELLLTAAYFILGIPPRDQPNLLFLAQIISSGLDADKLDYMCRESHYSGIPIGVDIPWLLSKLRVFKCSPNDLPRAYESLKHNFPGEAEFLVLGLVPSGQLEFEEFCFARVSLYDKIYLHQKSRALLAQSHLAFHKLVEKQPKFNKAHEWLHLKERDSTDENPKPDEGQPSLFTFEDSSLRLVLVSRTDALHRAFAFGPLNSLTDPVGTKDSLEDLPSVKAMERIRGNEIEWQRELQVELEEIVKVVPLKRPEESISIAFDAAQHLNIQQGHDSLFLQQNRRRSSRWILPVDMIVEYYRRNRSCGYVFANEEHCHYVAIASEAVFWKKLNQRFSQEEVGLPPHLTKSAADLKSKLAKKGFYDSIIELRPTSSFLASAAASELTHDVAGNLAGFQSYRQERVTPQRVAAFISQFPEPLQEAALQMCCHLQVIQPSAVADKVVDEYLKHKIGAWKEKEIALVPLGSIVESGALLSYNFKNHSNQDFLRSLPRVETLSDNLVMGVDAIIFYDDNINSGSQLLNIFAERLDKTLPASKASKESHGSKLSEKARERLIQLPMHFVFGVAPDTVLRRIRTDFSKHFEIGSDNVTLEANLWLKQSEKLLSGPKSRFQHLERENLRKFLVDVGSALMLAEGKSKKIALGRALGDENAEALIAFPYNVPTMTVLPFWCAGDLSKSELGLQRWIPLIERRRAKDPNGKFIGEDG